MCGAWNGMLDPSTQNFSLELQTGTTNLFFLAKTYPIRRQEQPFYDAAASSTSRLVDADNYVALYGTVEVSGDVYADFVRLFDFDRSSIQRFGVVDFVEHARRHDPPVLPDGALGLSWNPDRQPGDKASPVVNLFAAYPELPRFWCQWLADSATADSREYSVETSFGSCLEGTCEPMANHAPLYWFPGTHESLAFLVDGFFYGNTRYTVGFAHADSGVPVVSMPLEVTDALLKEVQLLSFSQVDSGASQCAQGWERAGLQTANVTFRPRDPRKPLYEVQWATWPTAPFDFRLGITPCFLVFAMDASGHLTLKGISELLYASNETHPDLIVTFVDATIKRGA
ncbi:hypothetical protein M3Y99_00240500 [Aphelenchoides fujianensis]|nr:hypothetical protein M3Y99_00240500 [Aphelenchoides fujianensis]